MYKGMDSYCGLSCEECEYREEFHCGGCMATGGNPFYGPCELAACARSKKVNFCGECKDFCCEMLTVILMMTRREMIRKGQGSNAAVR